MTDPVNILWTAGWDSTFRVSSLLLQHHRAVQPWYVIDPDRRSTRRELAAQARIRAVLVAKDPAVATLLAPSRVRRLPDIPADPAVTADMRALRSRSMIGSQYDWLCRLARAEGVVLELCIHRDDKAHDFLRDDVVRDTDGTYRLDPGTDDAALRIFEPFRFPLFDLTKTEMQSQAARDGFADVMELTWFCFSPLLDGKPCGFCWPCRYTREEGLGRRVPEPTPFRRAHYWAMEKAWRGSRRAVKVLRQTGARGPVTAP